MCAMDTMDTMTNYDFGDVTVGNYGKFLILLVYIDAADHKALEIIEIK